MNESVFPVKRSMDPLVNRLAGHMIKILDGDIVTREDFELEFNEELKRITNEELKSSGSTKEISSASSVANSEHDSPTKASDMVHTTLAKMKELRSQRCHLLRELGNPPKDPQSSPISDTCAFDVTSATLESEKPESDGTLSANVSVHDYDEGVPCYDLNKKLTASADDMDNNKDDEIAKQLEDKAGDVEKEEGNLEIDVFIEESVNQKSFAKQESGSFSVNYTPENCGREDFISWNLSRDNNYCIDEAYYTPAPTDDVRSEIKTSLAGRLLGGVLNTNPVDKITATKGATKRFSTYIRDDTKEMELDLSNFNESIVKEN